MTCSTLISENRQQIGRQHIEGNVFPIVAATSRRLLDKFIEREQSPLDNLLSIGEKLAGQAVASAARFTWLKKTLVFIELRITQLHRRVAE